MRNENACINSYVPCWSRPWAMHYQRLCMIRPCIMRISTVYVPHTVGFLGFKIWPGLTFVHYNPYSCHFVTFINRMWAAQGPNVLQLAHIHLLYSNSCLMPACSHPNPVTCCPRSLSSLDDNISSCINTNRMFNVLHIPKHTQEIFLKLSCLILVAP